MNTKLKIALAITAGAALGAGAMQGLHAQAKLKAYSIGELEPLGAGPEPAYLTAVRKAITDAHGRSSVIGYLGTTTADDFASRLAAFREFQVRCPDELLAASSAARASGGSSMIARRRSLIPFSAK